MPHSAPVPGEVYAAWSELLQRRFAVQVTHVAESEVGVTYVDPDSRTPVTFDDLHRSGGSPHWWCARPVPAAFELVGQAAPPAWEEPHAWTGWPDGSDLVMQARWEAAPEESRRIYKTIPDADRHVVLGPEELLSGTYADHALHVRTAVRVDGLVEALERHHFLFEAAVHGHGLEVLDLGNTQIGRLTIDLTGVRELVLPPLLTMLTPAGVVSPDLRITATADGVGIGLYGQMLLPGLGRVHSMRSYGVRDLDLAPVVAAYPALRTVFLVGGPGYLRNVDALAGLSDLEDLTLTDLYGYGPGDVPGPDVLTRLGRLDLDGAPVEAATAVKKAWKGRVELKVARPRQREWLAANLDNPFRDWDDHDHVTETNAKKAVSLYRNLRSALAKGSTDQPITSYVEGFNAMVVKRQWIQTTERELVMEALLRALTDLVADPAERERLFAAGDGLRDF